MKRFGKTAAHVVFSGIILFGTACTGSGEPPYQYLLEQISEPVFPEKRYDVRDFGAVGDGNTDSRGAINRAITQCSNEGGGQVIVPAGKYFSAGPVVLKSRVDLHLDAGCELVFSPRPEDYLPAVLTVWEGTELFNYSPLVYAYQVSDVALTGKGTLNGNASKAFARWRPQGSEIQDQLRQMGIDGVPVKDRYWGTESNLPPSMVQFFGCNRVLVEGVTIIDSPYWVIHPVFCNSVTVRGVEINSYNLNNDGCDPEYSTNVLIEDCIFRVGDDAIAIKAGRDNDAWRIGQPTRNIVIRRCLFNSLCNGLCIGSEMAAGVENVFMENIRIQNCLSGIYFKSNLDRGGFIRHVDIRNVECDSVRSAFIRFETNYHGGRGGFHPTLFEDFHIENIRGNVSGECGFYAVGIENYPLKNIALENVTLKQANEDYILKNVENITFDNVVINGKTMSRHPAGTEASRLQTE
ncbi:MAG: glycoside hydrolase family 28 protein [Dysgonamonadaceae bacterium]|jgi:polygalacturonase|nr:glycoside hydrolase family 28 protein [Dysgonamonadaceae bacterium]